MPPPPGPLDSCAPLHPAPPGRRGRASASAAPSPGPPRPSHAARRSPGAGRRTPASGGHPPSATGGEAGDSPAPSAGVAGRDRSARRVPRAATLVEVGPRDGFQAEATPIPTGLKVWAVDALVAAGLTSVQVASFVHPARVPQMADAEEVCARIARPEGVTFSGLALNARGVERCADAGLDAVDVSVSTNDAHSRRNAGKTLDEARAALGEMARLGRAAGLRVRAGLQCVWGCGADGPTPPERVRQLVEETLAVGVNQLSLADSTGEANPVSLEAVLEEVVPLAETAGVPVVLHLHDTRGAGLANVAAALRLGVTHFDTALGGMGGCPFIPGATGNIPTEDTALMLAGMGVGTGVDAAAVAAVSRRLESHLGHPFSGRTYSILPDPVSAPNAAST